MKLTKAIELLSDSANRGVTTFNQDYKDAQRLSIEALKRVRNDRIHRGAYRDLPLPSETED